MADRFFGTPNGVIVGDLFIDRMDLHSSGVHRPTQSGISGTAYDGSDSIVLSGGYVDDKDYGDVILYTGAGGQNEARTKQVQDQDENLPGNAGLITSFARGLPVRVSRGSRWKSPFSPSSGYRYAGLYLVTGHWKERGNDGFVILRFKLERIGEQDPYYVTNVLIEPDIAYATSTISRRIRDTELTRQVKSLYDNGCQVCELTVPGVADRTYSEGAHVRPLGRPHLGADVLSNILCLCPNHHVQLDIGGMVILNDFTVALTKDLVPISELHFAKSHRLNADFARYHRELWIA
jgi:putative restriction endonuclease